jgi:hypothetical protein
MRIVNEPQEIDGIRVVQDNDEIEQALKNGERVYHWEFGDSMSPLINNREYCLIRPCVPTEVKRGDAVFCVMSDGYGHRYGMVHQVWEISDASHTGELWFKIGSTGTSIFGWTKEVYGIAKGTDIFQEFTNKWKEFLEAEKLKAMAERENYGEE